MHCVVSVAKMLLKFIHIILLAIPVLSAAVEENNSSGSDVAGECILPPYPEHGNYTTTLFKTVAPGQACDQFSLNISCDPGYGVVGSYNVICIYGTWTEKMPKCIRLCKLNKHPSVIYRCPILQNDYILGSRDCNDGEPIGTLATPQCNVPNYYSDGYLPAMKCIDGNWDYVAVCNEDCGRMPALGKNLPIGANGYRAYLGQFPWHVGIYKKITDPYKQICGGSLISKSVVISAAHCFWNDVEKKLPAENFAVAAGKLYRPWNEVEHKYVQKSDVKEIKIPPRFQGNAASYQDDLAIVVVTSPFEYSQYVRPVCLSFDYKFDKNQLQKEYFGKVAGWGLTEKGVAAPILTVLNLPNVEIEKCITESPPQFKMYITSDKICAGYNNGTALCMGDSGGGFAIPNTEKGVQRYYLRGIVSTAPRDGTQCNIFAFTALTHVFRHEHFIKENL